MCNDVHQSNDKQLQNIIFVHVQAVMRQRKHAISELMPTAIRLP